MFALHRDGKIMYISETASVLLGLPQIDLTGSSIFDYVHPADHNDLMDMLSLNETDRHEIRQARLEAAADDDEAMPSISSAHHPHHHHHQVEQHLELGRSFSMRMKCILPKRNAGLIKNGYKSIHCTGYLKVRRVQKQTQQQQQLQKLVNVHELDQPQPQQVASYHTHGLESKLIKPLRGFPDSNHNKLQRSLANTSDSDWDSYALVAVGHSLLPTASTEIKLSRNSFMFRANLDLKIYYMEAT